VVESIERLTAVALGDDEIREILAGGDWYLVGSRATGLDDDLSDWDTIVLSRDDPTDDQRRSTSRARLDELFGVDRPVAGVPADLNEYRSVRRAHGVEINVYGPAGRMHRDGDGTGDVIWAYDLRHAIALRTDAGVGEPYRHQVAAAFTQRCRALRDDAYLRFRMARNEVAATLVRSDVIAQHLASARCVRHAARFWLLARDEPYPADKWLPLALERDPAADQVVPLVRRLTDAATAAGLRFDAIHALWRLVDGRAVEVGVDRELLTGSPFVTADHATPIA
jgi:hypothetical protein